MVTLLLEMFPSIKPGNKWEKLTLSLDYLYTVGLYRFPMQIELSWLLQIVLVNLNFRIGVHKNFAQSWIPALVCSPQSEYGCHQARSRGGGGNGAMPSLISKFRIIKYLKYKPKKYFSANRRNCLKDLSYFRF